MEDISIIGTIVGFIGGITLIFRHFDSKFDKKIDKINNDISDIKGEMGRIDGFVMGTDSRKSMIYAYEGRTTKKEYTGNPISPEVKQRLIEKFVNDTIERDEAEKLKQTLEEEKKEAETAGDTLATIAIGRLLAALAYLLEIDLSKNMLELNDNDPDVRQKAALALGKIGDARAVDALIEALKDRDDTLSGHAARALAEIGDASAVEALTKVTEA